MKHKYSKFNVIIPFGKNYILFNTLTKELLLINDFLRQLIESLKITCDIADLLQIHPDFYNVLIEKKFCVAECLDENQDAIDFIESNNNDDSRYKLIINPTMNCNFKCWYCYESHIKDSKMSEQLIVSVKNLISNITLSDKLKVFELSFFGGEPLLYFEKVMLPLITFASTICKNRQIDFYISITTNGYLLNGDILNKINSLAKNINYQITLDGDESEHNKVRFVSKKRGSYKEIVNNIKLAAEINNVTMRINFTKSNFASIKNILGDFENIDQKIKNNITISLSKVWQENDNVDSHDFHEVKNIIKSLQYSTPKSEMVDVVKYSCYADAKNQATVNYNGEVFKCTARDFKKENKEGDLTKEGIIKWNERNEYRTNFRLANKPCQECYLLPMCAGGCSQHALENKLKNTDYCVHNFDDNKKKQFVLDYLEDIIND